MVRQSKARRAGLVTDRNESGQGYQRRAGHTYRPDTLQFLQGTYTRKFEPHDGPRYGMKLDRLSVCFAWFAQECGPEGPGLC